MATNPAMLIRIAANVDELKKRLSESTGLIETTTASMQKLASSLNGDRLIQQAHNIVAAVNEIGGATKLTAAEKERLNGVLTRALEKYQAFGREAPAAMKTLAQETATTTSAWDRFSAMLGKANGLLGLFGVGIGAGAIIGFARSTFAAADSLQKMSDQTGISAVGLQRLQAVGDDAGNTIEEITAAVGQMQRRLAGGDDGAIAAIQGLHLSIATLKGLSPDQQFIAIGEAISKIQDPAERARVAFEIFGRTGQQILPTLRADIQKIADGTVTMSDEANKALDRAGDAWQRFYRNATREVEGWLGRMVQALGYSDELTKMAEQANLRSKVMGQTDAQDLAAMLAMATKGAPAASVMGPLGAIPLPDDETVKRMIQRLDEQREANNKAAEAAKKHAEEIEKLHDAVRHVEAGALPRLSESIGIVDTETIQAIRSMTSLNAQVELLQRGGEFAAASLLKMGGAITSAMGQVQYAGIGKLAPTVGGNLDVSGGGPNLFTSFMGVAGKAGSIASSLGALGLALPSGVGSILGGIGAGSSIGGIFGGPAGAAIGGTIGAAVGGIKALFSLGGPSKQELAGRQVIDQFQAQHGGNFNAMLADVAKAYEQTGRSAEQARQDVAAFHNATKAGAEASAAAVKKVQQAFDEIAEGKQAWQDVQDAAKRYGLTLEQLGPAFARQQLDERAQGLYKDWQLLTKAGGDVSAITQAMSGDLNEYVHLAMTTGQPIAAAMRPMLEQMARMGLLTDAAGNKLEDLTGINFSDSLSQGFQGVIDAINHMTDALQHFLDIPTPAKHVPVVFDLPDFLGGSVAVPGAALGGLVTSAGVQYLAPGGVVQRAGRLLRFVPRGTDTVPAMLTPGEGVVTRSGMQHLGADGLRDLNRGQAPGGQVVDLTELKQALQDQRQELAGLRRDFTHAVPTLIAKATATALVKAGRR